MNSPNEAPSHYNISKLEFRLLNVLWANGSASVREILDTFPEPRPAYTTIQTTIYRLERKSAIRRVGKIGNADIFEPLASREKIYQKVIDDVLHLFGGNVRYLMTELAKCRKLTLDDVAKLKTIISGNHCR